MTPRSALLNVMTKAVDKAARALKRDFGEVEQLQVSQKGPSDFVSNADLKAERILREELSKARPTFGFLAEESGAQAGSDAEHRWLIDPLDGTTNFLHGLPHFAISVALEKAGEILAGVIYDPIKNELFVAEKGAGAFMNDRRLRVSARKSLGDSLMATGIPFRGKGDPVAFSRSSSSRCARPPACGASAPLRSTSPYVALAATTRSGKRASRPGTVAAGILLVREAGGYISDLKGGQTMLHGGSILATNGLLHAPIQSLLKPH
jgi:myo-inositol-1(or 4)-monophosphatase